MSNCEQTEELLVDLLDDALDPTSRARVEEHLATCETCAETLRSYRAISDAYREIPEEDVSDEMADEILARARVGKPRLRVLRSPVLLMAAAAAAILLVWGFQWLGSEQQTVSRSIAILLERGDGFVSRGRIDRALEIYRDAASLARSDEEHAAIRHRLGTVYFELLRYEDALVELDAIALRFPNYSKRREALFQRARTLASLGETGRAIQAYQLVAAEFPDNPGEIQNEIRSLQATSIDPRAEQMQELQALGYLGDD